MLFSLLLLSYYVSLSFILFINGRHDIMKTISTANMKTISTTLEKTTSTALMRIFNDVASTRKNIDRVSRLASKLITPKDKFICMHRFHEHMRFERMLLLMNDEDSRLRVDAPAIKR